MLSDIRAAIRDTNADIVFLQEVIGENKIHSRRIVEWPDESQFEYLADTVWTHYAYGQNSVKMHGHHGNAVLSRYPIVRWENTDISNARFESRGVLHAVIQIPDLSFELHSLCVHLGLSQKSRKGQLEDITRIIQNKVPSDAPLLLAGDFNDWSLRAAAQLADNIHGIEVFRHFLGSHARTFPSWLPLLQLDRIYARGFAVRSAKVLGGSPWKQLSDHVALFAELEVKL